MEVGAFSSEATASASDVARRPVEVVKTPGGKVRATVALVALFGFAISLIGFRAGLTQSWRSTETLPGIVSWVLPGTILFIICGLAVQACRRFAAGIDVLKAEASWWQAHGTTPEATANIRDLLEACRGESSAVHVEVSGLPPLSARIVSVLARQAAAWQPLDPADAIARFGDARAERILAGAQTAVALGLLGSMLGLAVQAWQGLRGADASAVFGDDLATGVMVAVTTTVQGFVVAAYAAILERDYRERYAATADDTLAGLQNGALRASGRPRDVVEGFAATLDSFAESLGVVLADLGRHLPEEVRKGLEQASQTLAGVLTAPLDNSVNALGGRVAEIGNVVTTLDATIAAAGQRIAVGVEAVQQSAKSPQELAEVITSAVMALEAARAALEAAGDASNRATEGLAAMADRVAAAVVAVRGSGALDNASRLREIETRFAALCDQLERMLNAVSELSKQTLVGGFPPEPMPFAARMG